MMEAQMINEAVNPNDPVMEGSDDEELLCPR